MENEDKIILSDEELQLITGGTTDETTGGTEAKSRSGLDYFCEGFDTPEQCNSRVFCQWGQFTCHATPRGYALYKASQNSNN